MKPLVVIENATIDMMLLDERYGALLPCLKSIRQSTKRHCGGCRRRVRAVTTIDYIQGKKCIGALSSGPLQELKALLGAERIRVSYPTRNSVVSKTI